MIAQLIKLFDRVAVGPDTPLKDPIKVNSLAMQCGYMVHPDACTEDVVRYLEDCKVNYNSTFYKEWQDVEKRSELEMRIMQMLHYITTYGTDFNAPAFTLHAVPEEMQFKEFRLILPCTDRELFERLEKLLARPIALSDKLLDDICRQMNEYYRLSGWQADIDAVENREAQVRLSDIYSTLPSSAQGIMRMIIYKTCGHTMIIKDGKTLQGLQVEAKKAAPLLSKLDEKRMVNLASAFYRYKPLLLALRRGLKQTDPEGAELINRLRRMARKYHRPMHESVLAGILSADHSDEEIARALRKEKSAFVLVRIVNYLNSLRSANRQRAFIIRNGKLFVTPNNKSALSEQRVATVKEVVMAELTRRLAEKAKDSEGRMLTVKYPDNVELAAPVSEKQFVGNIPFGSYYTLRTNNLIGIYWRNEWGTHDFDLWLTGRNGMRIGWADSHKEDGLLFSGDMTDANPEATEIFYGKGDKWPDSIISVARYYGKEGSRFRLFFASDDIKELPEGYMVRPDAILLQEDVVSESRTTMVGVVNGGRVWFGALGTGEGMVPAEHSELSLEEGIACRLGSSLTLRELLAAAGFGEWDAESGEKPDIDLSELHKDTIMGLFD